MAHGEEKKNDSCIYVVSGLFLICILGGGACLAMYITLPETKTTKWYAITGLVLVGIPWVFWLLICMYRCCTYPVPANQRPLSTKKISSAASPDHVVAPKTSGTTAAGTSVDSPPVDSPGGGGGGGGRRVRFGGTTVVGGEDCLNDDEDDDTDGDIESDSDDNSYDDGLLIPRGTGTRTAETSSSSRSSFTSRESEQPLTFSMSS